MKCLKRILLVGALLGGLPHGVYAQEESETEFDLEAFEAQVKENRKERRKLATRMREERAAQPDGATHRMQARLEGFSDGTLYVSQPIPSGAGAFLGRYGFQVMARPPSIRDGRAVYEDRRYEPILASADVPDWKLRRLMGQDVELSVQMMTRGRGRMVTDLSPQARSNRR
ncbi:MAG: hypothetical protein ACFB9M_15690 [Myxococcota bacterium]